MFKSAYPQATKRTTRKEWFGVARYSPEAKILTLAAYEQARRALHGVCELTAHRSKTEC